MGCNGLIDPKPCFSPACCYSGPVQCPAGAPVAYKFSITAATVYKGITGFIDCRAARARRPSEFESKPEVLVGELVDQSKRGSPKREWMPKVRVKA